jgi:two-component system, OmpR family, response regulator
MLILVVEEDASWRSTVVTALAALGHQIAEVATVADAFASIQRDRPDLVLLDRQLPDGDGIEIVEVLRDRGMPLPSIVVSDLASAEDRVRGLNAGADDYLAKPVFLPELLARVEAVSRRSRIAESLRVGPLAIDVAQHRATLGGRRLELSGREFDLLLVFARNLGHGLTRSFLWKEAWGLDIDPLTNVVDVYVRHLRTKLGTGWVRTIRGVGYLFEPPAG